MSTLAIILIVIAIISVGSIYHAIRTAERYDENLEKSMSKFQPRQMTDLSTQDKPKRKKKRYYNKKKPAVAQNAPVEKRPVGRPRKTN